MTTRTRRPWLQPAWTGALIGAAAGLLVGWATYTLVNPVLEASEGPLRETQGLLWNLVPLLTLLGGVAGYLVGRRRE